LGAESVTPTIPCWKPLQSRTDEGSTDSSFAVSKECQGRPGEQRYSRAKRRPLDLCTDGASQDFDQCRKQGCGRGQNRYPCGNEGCSLGFWAIPAEVRSIVAETCRMGTDSPTQTLTVLTCDPVAFHVETPKATWVLLGASTGDKENFERQVTKDEEGVEKFCRGSADATII